MTDLEFLRKIQSLDSRYAALARSQYNFGYGTATVAPTPEEIAEIQAKMAAISVEMQALRLARKAAAEAAAV